MNITELARRLRVSTQDLKDKLPRLGFDIGQRAIKVDERVAQRIIKEWPRLLAQMKEEAIVIENQAIRKTASEQTTAIKLPAVLTVRDFASRLNLPVNKIISELMKNGILASLNERIDLETAQIVAEDIGFKVEAETAEEVIEKDLSGAEKIQKVLDIDKDNLQPRPPVVVVMGHVDHGKTKLLDTIRKTHIMEGEAGGITQHIGAYQVEKNGKIITFIDTPGHEAFTAIRSRGAKVADIAILVVAADDSIKQQTIEAIRIIQAVKLPMIVAINKIDKPEANIEKVKQDLAQQNLLPEDWGGKTICVPISAKTGAGVDDLLKMILLVADMEKEKIKANPIGPAIGTVIESRLDKGEGPIATILIQNGALKPNDFIVINGAFYGKVRLMKNFKNETLAIARPAMPAKIIGLKKTPQVGDIAEATAELKSSQRKIKPNWLANSGQSAIGAVADEKEEQNIKAVNLIIKADTLSSAEAICESLEKIPLPPDIKIKIVSRGLGNVNEAEVLKAEATQALILGFHVKTSPEAQDLASEKKVTIKHYTIIYKLIEELKKTINDLMEPEIKIAETAKMKILKIFRTDKDAMIVGGLVLSGRITPDNKIKVIKNGQPMAEGQIKELQINKQPAIEAVEGQEAGILYAGKPVINEGDILEFYKEEKIQRALEK
ncbi:MAG: translation initiation factor IF-2 [bacterium]